MTKEDIRVAFCGYDQPVDVGGVSSWLRTLLPDLRRASLDAHMLFFSNDGRPGANTDFLQRQGVPCTVLPWGHFAEDRVRAILRWVQHSRTQVFVPNNIVSAYHAAAFVKACGTPTIGALHSDDAFHEGILEEFVHGGADQQVSAVVCVSRQLELQARSKPTRARVERIPCGVAIPASKASRAAGPFRFLYSGRLSEEQKRIIEVVKALCLLVRSIPDTEAWIAGGGPDHRRVQDLVTQSGLGERLRLLGPVEHSQMDQIYQQSHALLLLSDYEGTPVSVMEAMAAGLVPICLKTRSGIEELIVHGENGIILENRSADILSAATPLVHHRVSWDRMSAAARTTAAAEFSSRLCCERWKALLGELALNGAPRASGVSIPPHAIMPPPNPKLAREDRRKKGILRDGAMILGTRWSHVRLRAGHKIKRLKHLFSNR